MRAEQCKYHLVISARSLAAAEEVSDLLSGPAFTTTYSILKAVLLERTTASQRSRRQQFLSMEELGDRQPSQLRDMRQLMSGYTTTTDEKFLRKLFLKRLLDNVQIVLATASTLDLNGFASLVDMVLETATPSVCNTKPPFNNNHWFAPRSVITPLHVTETTAEAPRVMDAHNALDPPHYLGYDITIAVLDRTRVTAFSLAHGGETDMATIYGDGRSRPSLSSN
ncbi:hypothetical protein HPB51_019114 [Rhipicephalus microplus]|uniref:DUF7041 domain-containing protein n=1 Tax=Rhipicephalus microplus TaxID=6941 RepID=A0A9J6EBR7_RHIMP|nr:hypothetical protein HPB51_019114 [Rhipicephalus microplus]